MCSFWLTSCKTKVSSDLIKLFLHLPLNDMFSFHLCVQFLLVYCLTLTSSCHAEYHNKQNVEREQNSGYRGSDLSCSQDLFIVHSLTSVHRAVLKWPSILLTEVNGKWSAAWNAAQASARRSLARGFPRRHFAWFNRRCCRVHMQSDRCVVFVAPTLPCPFYPFPFPSCFILHWHRSVWLGVKGLAVVSVSIETVQAPTPQSGRRLRFGGQSTGASILCISSHTPPSVSKRNKYINWVL